MHFEFANESKTSKGLPLTEILCFATLIQ